MTELAIVLLVGAAITIGIITLLLSDKQPDECRYHEDCVCCYPIEDCKNCPNHPGNEWM